MITGVPVYRDRELGPSIRTAECINPYQNPIDVGIEILGTSRTTVLIAPERDIGNTGQVDRLCNIGDCGYPSRWEINRIVTAMCFG